MATSTYGGNALFLAGLYDGICVSGDDKLDLFYVYPSGIVHHGNSLMAKTEADRNEQKLLAVLHRLGRKK